MSQEWNKNEAGGEEDVQMPLGVGGESTGEESFGEPAKPKMNNSTMILFGAFAVALAALYLLGLQNKPRAASAEQVAREQEVSKSIEAIIQSRDSGAKLKNLVNGEIPRLVKILRDYLSTTPNDSLQLAANPFEREMPRAPVEHTGMIETVLPQGVQEQAEMREVAAEFGKLKLQSIMIGARPAALISSKLVTPGAKLGKLTVSDIQANRVLLSFKQNTFELKLNAPANEIP